MIPNKLVQIDFEQKSLILLRVRKQNVFSGKEGLLPRDKIMHKGEMKKIQVPAKLMLQGPPMLLESSHAGP